MFQLRSENLLFNNFILYLFLDEIPGDLKKTEFLSAVGCLSAIIQFKMKFDLEQLFKEADCANRIPIEITIEKKFRIFFQLFCSL